MKKIFILSLSVVAFSSTQLLAENKPQKIYTASSQVVCEIKAITSHQHRRDIPQPETVVERVLEENESFSFDPAGYHPGAYWVRVHSRKNKGFYLLVHPKLPSGFMRIDLKGRKQAKLTYFDTQAGQPPLLRINDDLANVIQNEGDTPLDATATQTLEYSSNRNTVLDLFDRETREHLTSFMIGSIKRGIRSIHGIRVLSQDYVCAVPSDDLIDTAEFDNYDPDDAEQLRLAELEAAAEAERQRQAALAAEEAERQRQAALAAEEAERQRQAALAAEEAERQRQAALAAEEAERQRQAALAAAEAERQRQAALAAEEAERQRQAALAAEEAERQRQAALAAEEAERQRQLALFMAERRRQAEFNAAEAARSHQVQFTPQQLALLGSVPASQREAVKQQFISGRGL